MKNKYDLQEILSKHVLNFNLIDLIVELKKNDIPFSQIESMKSLFDSPEIQSLKMTDSVGLCNYVKFPLTFSEIES